MRSVIHKIKLDKIRTDVEVTKGSETLTVQMQEGVPTVWIEKLLEHPMSEMLQLEKRTYRIVMTGEQFDYKTVQDMVYVGTVQTSGIMVLHVYEEYNT